MSAVDVAGLKPGQMYRVRFRPPSGLGRDMEMTAKYLGTDVTGLAFNQRPKAGTTSVDPSSILQVHETDSPKVVLPHRVPNETRVV